MTENGYDILKNIIGGIKTGNNIYGKRSYNTYNLKNNTFCLGFMQYSGNNIKKMIQKIYNYDQISIPQGSLKSDIDYVRWAIRIADDNRYYYSHNSDPFSFSCSTLVAKALYECGYFKEDIVPADGHAIGGNDNSPLHKALFAAGFKKVPFSSTTMQAGDVMTVLPYHVAFCVGGNIMVAANGNGDMTDRSPTAITTYDYRLVGQPRWIFRLPEDKIHRSHSTVNKLDTVGIKSLLNTDWSVWQPTAAQKKVLISLANSSLGHKAQDQFFKEKMKAYEKICQTNYTKNTKAIMMYCCIRHLKGSDLSDKVFKECEGHYTLTNILKVLQDNKINETLLNQFKLCQKWIDKYVITK